MTSRPVYRACSMDWKRVLQCRVDDYTVENIILGNQIFRLGIYKCYSEFLNSFKNDHLLACKMLGNKIIKCICNPVEESLECANFSLSEEAIFSTLLRAKQSLNQTIGKEDGRVEHIILCYVMKLLDENEKIHDIPKIKMCKDNCKYGPHS